MLQRAELVAHLGAQAGIEVAERLVEQQHLGLEHQRAGDRHALLLAARQGRRRPVGEALHLDQAQRRHHALLDLGLGDVAHAQGIGDVVEHRHVRPDRVGLEHHAELAQVGRHEQAGRRIAHHAAADHDRAGVVALQARHHAQGRGLAAARRAQQGDELAVLDRRDRCRRPPSPRRSAGRPRAGRRWASGPTCRSAWRARAWRPGARAWWCPSPWSPAARGSPPASSRPRP